MDSKVSAFPVLKQQAPFFVLTHLGCNHRLVAKTSIDKKRASISQDAEPDDDGFADDDDDGFSEDEEAEETEELNPPFLGNIEEGLAEEFEQKVSTSMSKPKQKTKAKISTMQVVHPVHMYEWYDANEQHKLTIDVLLLSGTTSQQIELKCVVVGCTWI